MLFLPTASEIDYRFLAECNNVIHRWANQIGLERQRIACFAKQVAAGKGEIFDSLTEKDKELLLNNDREFFCYLVENENDFVWSNRALVHKLAMKYKMVKVLDYESAGMMAMVRAFYYYTDPAVPFVNFCCNGIQQELKSLIRSHNTNKQRNWRKMNQIQQKHMEQVLDRCHVTDATVSEEETPEEAFEVLMEQGADCAPLLNKIIKAAGLTDLEKELIACLVTRDGTGDWVEKFLHKTGLTISKQGVYAKKDALIRKLKGAVREHGVELFR
jgi:hypothetical protein